MDHARVPPPPNTHSLFSLVVPPRSITYSSPDRKKKKLRPRKGMAFGVIDRERKKVVCHPHGSNSLLIFVVDIAVVVPFQEYIPAQW
jgi:hypothetical protein